jgi:hypothetical protein
MKATLQQIKDLDDTLKQYAGDSRDANLLTKQLETLDRMLDLCSQVEGTHAQYATKTLAPSLNQRREQVAKRLARIAK